MQVLVIILVILFLFGSISMAMPSKNTRIISKLRLDAMKKGFKITALKISNFNFKSKDFSLMVYQLRNTANLKEAHFIRDKDELILYSPLKLKYSDDYNDIQNGLQNLSPFVLEIIFSNSSISFIWKENEGLDELIKINNLLKNF
mgnify:CR=1 FL=1